jgi:hypothetical protein
MAEYTFEIRDDEIPAGKILREVRTERLQAFGIPVDLATGQPLQGSLTGYYDFQGQKTVYHYVG